MLSMKKLLALLFITAFILSVLSAYSQGPSPDPEEESQNWQDCTTKTDKNGNALQYCRKKTPLLIKVQESKVANSNTDKQAQNINQNSSTKDFINIVGILLTALATIAMAVFTFFLVCYNKKMWETTTRSVAVAKEAADAAKKSADILHVIEKAYVIVTVNIPDYKKMELGSNGADVFVCNCGRTPATIIKFSAILLGKDDPLSSEAYNILPGTELGSNKDITIFTRLTVAETQRLEKAGTYCHVILEYEDIFRQRYSKKATWEYKCSISCPEGYWEPCENNNLNYYTEDNTK